MVILTIAITQAKAQTAAYICPSTGAYGYYYGASDASTRAYNECVQHGGQNPTQVFSTYSKGYGALAIGRNTDGIRVIGASGGYSSREEANKRAINECIIRGGTGVAIQDTWNDE